MATTKDLKTEFLRLNRMIAQIEAKPQRELTAWTSTLQDLKAEREHLETILRARRQEASKKIVDFHRWRDGSLMPPPAAAPRPADRAFLTFR
jgi:hypothetical protein